MQHVSTIGGVIDAFGGASALGRHLGISQEAISLWRSRGVIPGGWHLRLVLDAHGRGVIIDPIVFGLDDENHRVGYLRAFGAQSCAA